MPRDKKFDDTIAQLLPTARELTLEFEYSEGDPREAMRDAFHHEIDISQILDSDTEYNNFSLIRKNAPKGKLLNPKTEAEASKNGELHKYEFATLKTAYQLNDMGVISEKDAREVVDAEREIADRYKTETPFTRYSERLQKSDRTR